VARYRGVGSDGFCIATVELPLGGVPADAAEGGEGGVGSGNLIWNGAAMSLAEKLPRRFTYAHYCRWPNEERWELIDGEAWDMSPAPIPLHQEVSGRLFYRLYGHLRNHGCRVFAAPIDLLLPDTPIPLAQDPYPMGTRRQERGKTRKVSVEFFRVFKFSCLRVPHSPICSGAS